MSSAPLVIAGASDQAVVLLDILARLGVRERVVGIADASDDGGYRGRHLAGHEVMVTLSQLTPELFPGAVVLPAIGSAAIRAAIFEHAKGVGLSAGTVVDPTAVVSEGASVGAGVMVAPRAYVGPEARIGDGTIINTGAIIEHHVSVGEFCHVGPGAILTGHVSVGDRATVGAGACVRDQTRIGRDAVVGAGAAVVNDVPHGVMVLGVPARVVEGW